MTSINDFRKHPRCKDRQKKKAAASIRPAGEKQKLNLLPILAGRIKGPGTTTPYGLLSRI